jgi:hypothetical protein
VKRLACLLLAACATNEPHVLCSESEIVRDHGLEPQFFAYPFGERTDELDHAMIERISAVRANGRYCER